MARKIASAGYVIANNEAIWAYGTTVDEAREMFNSEMASNGVTVISDDHSDDLTDQYGSWTRESDYRVLSASAALLAKVERDGGNISWVNHLGVACTEDERDEAFA